MEIPSGYAQANFLFSGIAVPTGAQVTLGIDHSSHVGDPSSVALALRNAWADNLMPRLNTGITLDGVLVKFGPTATGPSALVTGSTAGTNGGQAEVPNVSALVHKVTPIGGRAGRGRFYLPGVTGDVFDSSGIAAPAWLGGTQDALNEFLADLVVADLTPVLLHGAGAPVSTPTPVTNFVIQARAATQRRRLRR